MIKQNIVLIGFMGTGKTTIGKTLSAIMQMPLIDLDEAIVQQEGLEIPHIFREKGEPYFREIESNLLKELLHNKGQIITTGGGAVLSPDNVAVMMEHGVVVTLHATEEEIIRRLAHDTNRPLLTGNPADRVKELLKKRAGLYDFAPIQIDTTGKNTVELAKDIAEKVISYIKGWQD